VAFLSAHHHRADDPDQVCGKRHRVDAGCQFAGADGLTAD
jgi:hypothetical protein